MRLLSLSWRRKCNYSTKMYLLKSFASDFPRLSPSFFLLFTFFCSLLFYSSFLFLLLLPLSSPPFLQTFSDLLKQKRCKTKGWTRRRPLLVRDPLSSHFLSFPFLLLFYLSIFPSSGPLYTSSFLLYIFCGSCVYTILLWSYFQFESSRFQNLGSVHGPWHDPRSLYFYFLCTGNNTSVSCPFLVPTLLSFTSGSFERNAPNKPPSFPQFTKKRFVKITT